MGNNHFFIEKHLFLSNSYLSFCLSPVSPLYYSVAKGAGIGRSPYPLFFCLQMLVVPTHWVFIDILSACFIIISVTHNMFGIRALKHFFYSKFLLAATRSQRLKRANYIIQGRGGACSSRLFMQKDNCMDMVGHNNIIFNGYTRKSSLN